MDLSIEHRTRYQYSETVHYTIQQLRLTPRDGFGQRVKRWEIRVNGHLHRFDDTHGNTAHTLVLDGPHNEINIIASGEVETGLDVKVFEHTLPLEVYLRNTELTDPDVKLQKFAARYVRHLTDKSDAWLEELMGAIVKRVPYVKGSTGVETTAANAFNLGTGVCQDHAHIFIACCRQLGIPARYVSGYLFTQDGSLMESHAWADIWRQESGWQSYDVSNGCRTNGVHVRLAVGLDYRDACPTSGMRVGGGMETMGVSVLVNQSNQMQQAQQ
jgi:transglutaminase-like putative cysteine protease